MIPVITTWLVQRELAGAGLQFQDAIRFFAEELGAIAVEIPRSTYHDWSPAGIRELKRLLHRHGLFCAALAAQNHFNCPDPAERRREVALVKDFIRNTSFMGARVLNIFHAGWGDREQGRRLAPVMLECLREVTAFAEENGVVLALESHGPLTDNVAELRQLFASCPSEYLRLNFDTANLYEGPEGNLQLLDLACHVHIKASYRDKDGVARDPENVRVLRALKASGYRGTVTMESVDGDPIQNLPAAYSAFCEMLRSL